MPAVRATQADATSEATGRGEGESGRPEKRQRIFADHLRLSELTQGIREVRILPQLIPHRREQSTACPWRCRAASTRARFA